METSNIKMVTVFVIIIGCFAVLYPKIFHPMLMQLFNVPSREQPFEQGTNLNLCLFYDFFMPLLLTCSFTIIFLLLDHARHMPPHFRKAGMSGSYSESPGHVDEILRHSKVNKNLLLSYHT